LLRTKGFCWVIDGNKRNLIGIVWELDETKKHIDELLMGTRGI
jgi:hypothetical protein